MRRATDAALDRLEDLLTALRAVPGIIEKKRGIFYQRSQAFLHFHEDPSGMYADLHLGPQWQRLAVDTPPQQRALVEAITNGLAAQDGSDHHGG